MIHSFLKKKLALSWRAPQENDAKFRFPIHVQGIRQFHDNCKIAKCQIVATLAPVYPKPNPKLNPKSNPNPNPKGLNLTITLLSEFQNRTQPRNIISEFDSIESTRVILFLNSIFNLFYIKT